MISKSSVEIPAPRHIHVVLVEDDTSMRQAMHRLLKAHDMRVTVFSSAEEFLTSGEDPPDCLVLDIQLESMSGLELQALLAREHPGYPIVFLTSSREERHRAAATSLGCAAYIHKTDPASTLIAAIRHAVAKP